MVKIILATSNPHKLDEINKINDYSDITFDVIKGNFNPDENGQTFKENATIKAKEASKTMKTYCLADDSGLCVDYLNGLPGIHSARYAPTQKEKIDKILNKLNGVPFENRKAHFTCAMVLTDSNGNVLHTEEGKVYGYIDEAPKGSNGFGYDPIFLVEEYGKTVAQLSENIKNNISHRAKALKPMLEWISNNL